jgi:hypothetical protein
LTHQFISFAAVVVAIQFFSTILRPFSSNCTIYSFIPISIHRLSHFFVNFHPFAPSIRPFFPISIHVRFFHFHPFAPSFRPFFLISVHRLVHFFVQFRPFSPSTYTVLFLLPTIDFKVKSPITHPGRLPNFNLWLPKELQPCTILCISLLISIIFICWCLVFCL